MAPDGIRGQFCQCGPDQQQVLCHGFFRRVRDVGTAAGRAQGAVAQHPPDFAALHGLRVWAVLHTIIALSFAHSRV